MRSPGIALRGSFKRQIILTFVVGFFALATTFAVYMVESERTSLYQDSGNTTTGLAQSLAVSSLSWALANDVVGLQEVVQSFRGYPELRYAMVISPTGRVMAHSDAAKVGQFLGDEQSLALVKAAPAKQVLRDDESVIDVAVPIEMGKRHVGWARIGLGREGVAANLRKMIWNVTFFVLLAAVLSLFAAVLVVNRLGRRIGSLVTVAKDVQAGNFATRVPDIPGSEDEITKLANGLNLMLDALARNEERLRAASLYTRSLIEASLDPLVTINPEGKITDLNQATEVATGRSRSELIGTDFSDCFAEPDRAREAYRHAFLKGFVSDYSLVLHHRNGHFANMLYNASVYKNEKGEVLGVLASARDITEHRRAELARSQLAAIVESSSDAIIGKTPEGIITSWNKGAEKIYGYSADEIVGRHITMLAPPSLHAEIRDILERVGKGATVNNYESERIRKDGTRFHVALTLSPIRDESGNISGISTIARDITQRKLDEAALHRLNRELHAISNCNQILMRAEDEQALLGDICQVVCDDAGYRMAWVGYPENDEAKTIRPVAWAGVEDGYLAQAGITWADTARGRGPSGTAIRNGKSACIQDFSTDPLAAPWRESALQRGYRSSISLPLKNENANTFGNLTIYSTEPDAFTPAEIRLLEELAGDLAFGIIALRTRAEGKRMESLLSQREHEYRTLAENSPDVIVRYDRQGRRIYVNPEFERVNRLTAQQVLGKTTAELSTELKPKADVFTERLMAAMESGTADKVDLSWDKDGKQICWFVRVAPEFDANGKVTSALTIWSDITERKLAEETLRREQALLNRIMVTSPVGIAVVSMEGQITFANPQAERILGLSKEEMTQRSYNAPQWHSTAIDGGSFPDEEQPFIRVMEARQPVFDVQHAIEWPDGRRVLLSINGAPIFDAQGEIEAVAFAIEDITERKQAEEQLRRSEQSLIESQRMAHVGSWHMDLATNEVFWSEVLYKMYGFDPALPPPLYTESMKLFTPESWEKLSSAIARAVETGISYELELELVPKDGGSRWMLSRGELARDERGAPVMVRGVVMDITERKRVDEALLFVAQRGWQIGAENFFDALAQFLGEKLDMDYVLIDRIDENPDMAETVALYAKGAITPNMRYALKGTPCENVMGKQLCIYRHGIQQLFPEDTLLPGMGAESYIGIPLWDSTGRSIGLIAVMGNKPLPDDAPVIQLLQLVATRAAAELERKLAEEEISKLNQELEHRVAERTAQLEEANKELESFSYSVSHDLRTPLRAIDGFSHILLEDYAGKLDDEGKRLLNVVRNNTSRMGQLIDDILQFSRTGRLEISFSRIDMGQLAYSVFVELRPVVVGDKLQLEIGHIPPAWGDSAMMRQVFVNLLTNAIKFSSNKEPAIIKVGGSVEGNEAVYFVKDNGAGFDMQYADKLFGVFQRLHSVNEFEGTGIGLAIVKRIITRHGGRVWAEGKVNEGATFYFALPRPSSKEHAGGE
jgi:PAS domain S-box-containing protein